jgi:hypothetical protein
LKFRPKTAMEVKNIEIPPPRVLVEKGGKTFEKLIRG